MASNDLLIKAASGLEKFMLGAQTQSIKDSTVAQVSAAIYYQSQVMANFVSNPKVHSKFSSIVFNQIKNDFGAYIDAQARIKPRSLHHVYEWKKAGSSSARLFKLKKISQIGFSVQFDYEFTMSKSSVPSSNSKKRYVFANKASVMEAGMPIKIAPRSAERLVFEHNGYTVFMPKGASVTVRRPGGSGVKNSFYLYYSRFFGGNLVNESIRKSGFHKIFGGAIAKSLNLPSDIKRVKYSFSPNTVRAQSISAIESAIGAI